MIVYRFHPAVSAMGNNFRFDTDPDVDSPAVIYNASPILGVPSSVSTMGVPVSDILTMDGTQTLYQKALRYNGTLIGIVATLVGESVVDSPGQGKNPITGFYHADAYASVHDAVAAAPAGETIYLSSTTYDSAVSLPLKTGQRLLGCGIGISVIDMTADVDGISGVDLSDVTIEGMTIQGPGRAASPSIGCGINFTLSGDGPNATFYVKLKDLLVQGFGIDGIAIDTPVASSFINVRPWTNARHGFNTYGAGEADGTSNAWVACYAAGNFGSGYRLHQIAYSSLSGCAADANGIQYEYDTCIGITENGCGSEEPYDFTAHVAGSAGCSRKLFNSKVTLNSPYSIGNIGTAYWATNGAVVTANCPFEGSPGNSDSPTNNATNSWLVDAGCKVVLNAPVYTTPLALAAGTTTVLPDDVNAGNAPLITGQETTLDDIWGSAATSLGASGSVRLTYFTAKVGGSFTKLRTLCSTTAAAATPTYAAMGLYSVAANGDLTQIAQTDSDTSLWATINTPYEKATQAGYTLIKGARYAGAQLIVTGAALPLLVGKSSAGSTAANTELAKAPRKTGSVAATTLPSSIAHGDLGNTATALYMACS